MSEYDFKTYRLKITVITPLHIGNGREMLRDYDYAVHGGRTWRINENALLEAQDVEDPRVAQMLARVKPAELLRPEDFTEGSPYFRYILKGTPKSFAEGAMLREQIKDVFDHPYLPGTTIKGALRTVLGWHLWEKKGLRPEVSRLGGSPKFAASGYERDLFGKNPNHDLLRALQISDSQPLGPAALMLANVRVLTQRGKPGSPVEVEAIRRDTVIETELKLDTVLFSQWAKARELYLPNSDALLNFAEVARQYGRHVIQRELTWAKGLTNGKNVAAHYQSMLEYPLAQNAFFLQLGWGGGWEQKTFGSRLKRDEGFMRSILKPRNQGGYDVARGHQVHNVQDFPISRRIVMAYQRNAQGEVTAEIPALPLGWLLVTVTEDGEEIPEPNWRPQVIEEAAPALVAQVEVQTPVIPAAKPASQPLIERFESIPKIGDRFRGEVFNQEGRALELFIPGLDDTVAAAYIAPENNPSSKKYTEGDKVVCEVIGLKQIGRIWQVLCRRV